MNHGCWVKALLFYLLSAALHCYAASNSQNPFVLLPSAFFWDADNAVYVTPLLAADSERVDIKLTVERENNLNLNSEVFTQTLLQRPSEETTKFTVRVDGNASHALKYRVRVNVTGHSIFYTHVNGGPNVRRVFLQTDKIFYKPSDTVNIRSLPLTNNGEIYTGEMDFRLLDGNGFRIAEKTLRASADDGFIATEFALPRYLRFGNWKVEARARNSLRGAEAWIRVKEYAIPKYNVLLTVQETDASPFIVDVSVLARFAHGMNVAGEVTLRCALATNRENETASNGGPVAENIKPPAARKLVEGVLTDGVWTSRVDVSGCVGGAVAPNRASSGVYATPKIQLIASVNERGTFLPQRAVQDYDPYASGFQLIALRPAFTRHTRKILLYLRVTNAPTARESKSESSNASAVQMVAQCVSENKSVNGWNQSIIGKLGTIVELTANTECTVYVIHAKRILTENNGVDKKVYSREEQIVIPALFSASFLTLGLIEPTYRNNRVEYAEGDVIEATVSKHHSSSTFHYFVDCSSREIVAAGEVPADGRLTLALTSRWRASSRGSGSAACVLFVYEASQHHPSFHVDMFLFIVSGPAQVSCPDEYSMELSSHNISVFSGVDVTLRGIAGSFALLHAYDSRLDGLLKTQNAYNALHGGSLSQLSTKLWTFAEFMSPDWQSDFVYPSNLMPMARFSEALRSTCKRAGRLAPSCPLSAKPVSTSFIADVCLREMYTSCREADEETVQALRERPQVLVSSLFGPSTSEEQESSRPDQLRVLLTTKQLKLKSKNIMDDAKIVGQKSVKSAEEEMDLREHFPEVWLFDSHRIGNSGELTLRNVKAPHSVTEWRFATHFWSLGRADICAPPLRQSVVVQKRVFMDVDLPCHVYENETVQVRVTVSADNVDTPTNMAVCFGGLSPTVCGDVGRQGDAGETDYTRIILAPDAPVQLKTFYVKFLRDGVQNLTFELREESLLPGGDWHCRDKETKVFDRLARQVRVNKRVDLEEQFRQVIVYRTKRIDTPSTASFDNGSGVHRQPTTNTRFSSPDVIHYSQIHNEQDGSVITHINVNTPEEIYNVELEFAKFVPSFPPSLTTMLSRSNGASAVGHSPINRIGNPASSRSKTTPHRKRWRGVHRNRRSIFDDFASNLLGESALDTDGSGYSLAAVLKELAFATYQLKTLKSVGGASSVAANEIEEREAEIGGLLSELISFSDCVTVNDTCGFGEFGSPKNVDQRNILLTTMATSLLCEQSAPEEYVCGPLTYLASVAERLTLRESFSDDELGFATHIHFETSKDRVLFMQAFFERMVLDCGVYSCTAAKQSWSKLHKEFYKFSEFDQYDLRTEAMLAYVSTIATGRLMRDRLASNGRVDRLPFWNVVFSRRLSGSTLDSSMIKSANILTNALALLAFTLDQHTYAIRRREFDFDALSTWLVEQQSANRQFENVIDTYFGTRALYNYQLMQMPTSSGFLADDARIFANLSAPTFRHPYHFGGNDLPFAISIPPSIESVTLSTRGDGRLLIGVRVLTARRRRSKRDPFDAYPVTIRMAQARHSATSFINQTVTLIAHSVLLSSLEIEHGLFTGFTTQPDFVIITNGSAKFLIGPKVSSAAVHFVLHNLKKGEPISYSVMLTEPAYYYSPENLAPIAISAIRHSVMGRLIVLPSSISFYADERDGVEAQTALAGDNPVSSETAVLQRNSGEVEQPFTFLIGDDNSDEADDDRRKPVVQHPPASLALGRYRLRNRGRHLRRRHLRWRREGASSPPQFGASSTVLSDSAPHPVPGAGKSNALLGGSVHLISDASDEALENDKRPAAVGSPNLQSASEDLVETVCLANGACTCAELTCRMQCANCSFLTFDAMCRELRQPSRFSVIFRIQSRRQIKVNNAEYTVFDVKILDWFGVIEAPEELSIWLRDCNLQCHRMIGTSVTSGGSKPRFLLIGDAEGVFDGSEQDHYGGMRDGDDWPTMTTSRFTQISSTESLSVDPNAETPRRMRAAMIASLRGSLLRAHYVMRDNDRLARSTDCWPLFGRLQDESCDDMDDKE